MLAKSTSIDQLLVTSVRTFTTFHPATLPAGAGRCTEIRAAVVPHERVAALS
jgi:hypothetical protein